VSIGALVGGQYGSEGKGLIAKSIGPDYGVHVRVGAANAGHTLYDEFGVKQVMQQLPCAAYANPDAALVIGPGALISLEILEAEMERNALWRREHGFKPMKLYIDYNAHIIGQIHKDIEANSGLATRIGSTSTIAKEGVGPAQAERVMRSEHTYPADTTEMRRLIWELPARTQVVDTASMLHDALSYETDVLLEGTQGTGLSLTTGQYPYVTSRNVTASGLAADCGVGPTQVDRVICVLRTYPIRVAGPSGPFFEGSEEISWADIGVDEQKEKTTVTKKIRRVATFSLPQAVLAARLNGATEFALTFCDYLDPAMNALRSRKRPLRAMPEATKHWPKVHELIEQIEHATRVPVTILGCGPDHIVYRKSALETEDVRSKVLSETA
jgi:adenylosuccinate synthase